MLILLNLIPIKKGGGQQVATNFLNIVQQEKGFGHTFIFVVTEGTYVDQLLNTLNVGKVMRVKPGVLGRLLFEYITLKKVVAEYKPEVLFTMFGPGLPSSKVKAVLGCAYSNIFYPEVDFWKGWPLYKRFLFYWIDRFRLQRTLEADGIIFENRSMEERAKRIFHYNSFTTFIKPSITTAPLSKAYSLSVIEKMKKGTQGFRVLILSGWHKNKNIEMVPSILQELKKNGIENISFVITVSSEDYRSKVLKQEAREFGVEDQIEFIGTILPTDVQYVYENTNAVLLLSLLESFSNNIIESWTYKKPLIISDLEWSRSICNNAAVYVNRENPSQIAQAIQKLRENENYYKEIVTYGLEELSTYPSPTEKVKQQLDFIDQIVHG